MYNNSAEEGKETTTVEEDFGKALRAYRQARQLTQAQLATQGGVALRTLSYWESGHHLPGAHEISSIADALKLSLEERQTLLVLLPTQKAGKLLRAAPALAEVLPPPGLGDLIRALRWRRRLPLEQLAARLGVHRTTVLRWEHSRSAPNDDTRRRLCDLLGVLPADRTALLASLDAPLWDANPPGLEECEFQTEQLYWESYRAVDPLFDLRAHLLAGAIWQLAARQPQARSLLVKIYSAHAQFACLRGDDAAALDFTGRALQMIRRDVAPHEKTLIKTLWANFYAQAHQSPLSAPRQNLRLATQWLSVVQVPGVRAHLLLTTAWCALQVGLLQQARDCWQEARNITSRIARPSPLLPASLQSTYADLLVAEERYEEGLEAVSRAAIDSYMGEIERGFFLVSVFIKTGSKSEADNSLRRLYSLIAVHQADYYREGADELAAQLERMA